MHLRSDRRQFLNLLGKTAAGLALAPTLAGQVWGQDQEKLAPIRALTTGPRHHWFGYYDKLQFDPTSRYVLGMEVVFEHRSPTADDVIRIGMIDLEDHDRWTDLGSSRAWSWQQGCMLQWIPGSKHEVIWNDRMGDHFVSHIHNVRTRETRTLPAPIYALSPHGKVAITTDFRRLNDLRPGYGYAGLVDPHREELTPTETGLWTVDLATGAQKLLFSYADVAKFGTLPANAAGARHWFNHLLFNPNGERFVFLHRWRPADEKKFYTRMISSKLDGTDWYVIDPSGNTSHFIWRDNQTLLAWTRPAGKPDGFYLLHDKRPDVEQVGAGVMTVNGHNTYLPGNDWILNDTYPDKDRLQHPYVYQVSTGKRVPLGHFKSPAEYTGEWRCDNHPRFSPNGKKVVIDSPHGGQGRQMYLLDISEATRAWLRDVQ